MVIFLELVVYLDIYFFSKQNPENIWRAWVRGFLEQAKQSCDMVWFVAWNSQQSEFEGRD